MQIVIIPAQLVCNGIAVKTSTGGQTDGSFVLQEFQIGSLHFCGLHPGSRLDDS